MVLPIATLLCGFAISSKLVSATPTSHIQQRAPYFPEIVRPTASSYWALDHNAFVSWDASKVPSDADPIPWVQLYNTTDTGSPNYVATLVSNFPAQPGRVDFTVPEVVPGSYFVMLGEWGQSSPHFTIGSIYIPFAPVVISPTSTTVWQVGSQQTVVWATDNIPDDNENTVDVQLYKTGDFGGPEFQVTLATGIPPEQGNVSVTVPDVPAGDKYFLMVAHWGNDSPHFSIVQ